MDIKELANYYDNCCNNYQTSWEAASWASEDMQWATFGMTSSVGDLNDKTVLDLGCGQGDLYKYLKLRNVNCNYLGIDVSEKMIEKANKRFPNGKFVLCDFMEERFDVNYDFIIAAGTFGIKMNNSDKYIKEIIGKMYKLCNIACSFTLLSPHGEDEQLELLQYFEPEFVIKTCLELTHKVNVNHVSIPQHSLVYLYK